MLPGIFYFKLILIYRRRAAGAFDLTAAAFAGHSALLRGGCRPGWTAGFGWFGSPAQQNSQPVEGILPVLFLGAKATGLDHQHAFGGQPLAGQPEQTLADLLRQGGRMGRVETKLDGCGHFINILPARPRRPDELILNFTLVNRESGGDLNSQANTKF